MRTVSSGLVVAVCVLAVAASAAAELEEITVTATKRAERLRDVPLSVSVLTPRSLEDGSVYDVFGVARLVPSFEVAQSTGPLSTGWYIRRIGSLGGIPNFEPSVGVFVDGAFRNRGGASVGDLFDLQQVEIARGPQSTINGKNTTAGLISITTNAPGNEFDLSGNITAGVVDSIESANLVRLEGVVNAPVTSSMAFRAGGVIYSHDETMLNLFNGDHGQNADRYTVRSQLKLSGAESFDARLIANRFRVDSAKLGDLVLFEGNAIQGINAGFNVPCPGHDIDDRLFCRNYAGTFDLVSNDLALNIHSTIGGLSITSISSFEDYESSREFDADQLNIDVLHVNDRQRGSDFSQELRIQGVGGSGPDWLAGAFYLDSEFRRGSRTDPTAILGADAPNLEFLPGVPVGDAGNRGFFDSASDTRHLSVFGSVEWSLNPELSVRTGLRWQTEDKTINIVNAADHVGPSAITLQLMPTFADASMSRKSSGTSWEFASRYRINEESIGYLLASHGFKSGGFNAGFGATPPEAREFDDEEVDNVELGFKSHLMDGRLRLDAALFTARYRNFQSAGWVSLRFLVNNAERVDVRGLEVDVLAAVNDRLSAGASMSWVDARYDRYTNGSCYYDRLPDNVDATACDLSGRMLPLAPRLRSQINLTYERPFRSGSIYGRFDWSWSSDYHTNSTLDPRHIQQAQSRIDARLGYRFDRWDISAWIQNAGDELVVMREGQSNLFPRDPAYGRAFAFPRTYGLTVRARY